MWPGSEVPIGGRQATVWTRYSSKPDYYQRADWVIDAMTRPEAEIPELVMWYFEEPDAAMHTYGPESPEAVGRAEHIDSVLRYFFREIRRSPVFDRINFIVTADHGMAGLSPTATSTCCRCSTRRRSCVSFRARRSVSKSRKSMRTKPCAHCAARAI